SIPLAQDLYGDLRPNSAGLDLANDHDLIALNQTAQKLNQHQWQAQALGKNLSIENIPQNESLQSLAIVNPASNSDIVGHVQEATATQVNQALENAMNAQSEWSNTAKNTRAACLQRAADIMQSRLPDLMILLCRESGKTYANAIAEVREAVDFLRYYATQIENLPANAQVKPLGTVLCISPWNFPLAIFSGQIAAALVSGNCVIAKPAEQTPLIASQAVQMLWEAGVPHGVVQLIPGRGETVGAQLSQDDRIQGIMFTGS
ncbi:MAG: aldehyde dehydrogenase family protein, partial [Acinetobacter sp.]